MKKLFIIAFLTFSSGIFALNADVLAANPAYEKCMNDGALRVETRTDRNGGEDGVCIWEVELGLQIVLSECGQWSYFREECRPGDCMRWSVDSNSCQTPF